MNLSPGILYEDDSLLVINKPSGVVVNRARTVKEETLQDWASSVILNPAKQDEGSRPKAVNASLDSSAAPQNDLYADFYNRSGIVHRIDRETSGCLVIAKVPEAFFKLQAGFKERLIKKTYIALVHGKLVPETGEINAPVGRLPWNREQFGVVPGGKEAVTKYKVLQYYSSSEAKSDLASRGVTLNSSRFGTNNVPHSNNKEIFSLVELYPESGRTHQIRVHLKYINHPIVGDYLYAGRKTQRDDRVWCPRVFLHAAKIKFPHPILNKTIAVSAPLPLELEEVLKHLNKIIQ